MDEIRKKAEKIIQNDDNDLENKYSKSEIRQILHELRVHQVELEIQNQELQESRQELERTKEEYFTLFNFAPVGYVILDNKGIVRNINMKACELIEREKSIIRNQPFIVNLEAKSKDEFFQHLQQVKNTSSEIVDELKIITRNKNEYYIEIHSLKLRNDFIMSALVDITQRKKDAQELLHAKEKAVESDILKSNFLANISHEIRTPMNSILGFAELLKKENLSEKGQNFIEIINNRSKSLLVLIDDIIDFAQIESGNIKLNETDFNLNVLLKDVYDQYKKDIQRGKMNQINFSLETAFRDDEAIIRSDKTRLRQILVNLVDNALKFTYEGEVKLWYQLKDEKTIEFFVHDTGIGISDNLKEKIFGKFIQVDGSATRKFGGTGLGLSITKGCLNILGGKIKLDSEVGKGSTFSFTIPYNPVKAQSSEISKKSESEPDLYNWEGKIILIVEDDINSYVYLSTALQPTKALIIHARNGQRAIKLCKTRPEISIVLMDIELPDINGFDVTRKIKEINPDLPVIAQSAQAKQLKAMKKQEAVCDDYIIKPYSVDDIFHVISKYI